MFLVLPWSHPWRKVSQLAIVATVSKPHLWAYENNLAVMNDHTTIVDDIFVHDRPIGQVEYDAQISG